MKKQLISKQEKKAHKQAERQARQNARGKVWQAT